MTEIGGNSTTAGRIASTRHTSRNLQPVLFGVAAALPALIWAWDFTVDDALITARVTAHVARGLGYRFNPAGPVVDAVTPLGLPYLLAPLARGGTIAAFVAAKWLGAAAWLFAAGLLARAIARQGARPERWLPLAVLLFSLPCAAWAASGMETGLVTMLATLAVSGRSERPLAAGLCAALRPELAPWALVLAALGPLAAGRPRRAVLMGALAALAPAALVALARAAIFGRALPLAFYAKPSDLEHGLRYTLGGLAFTGLPWLLLAPWAARRVSPRCRIWLAAVAAHALALTLAGGDWMALYRLWVPVLPTMALAGAELAEHSARGASLVRGALALGSAALLTFGLGRQTRGVGAERAQLIAEGRGALAFSARTLSLDAGWVGALGESEVVDLAGVTDATVAFFPGGHTSKRIPEHWLRARDPDAIVLLLGAQQPLLEPYWESRFARAVEQDVARALQDAYRVRTTLPFGEQRYLVLERAPRAAVSD